MLLCSFPLFLGVLLTEHVQDEVDDPVAHLERRSAEFSRELRRPDVGNTNVQLPVAVVDSAERPGDVLPATGKRSLTHFCEVATSVVRASGARPLRITIPKQIQQVLDGYRKARASGGDLAKVLAAAGGLTTILKILVPSLFSGCVML
jgi:hypothetical protein